VVSTEAAPSDDTILEAPALLKIIWADPQHMAEHLALWSLARFGGRAERVVDSLRDGNPEADRDVLENAAIVRQTRITMTEGAFVGGPFVVLIPFAFCAALLSQAQLVYELAAIGGRQPTDHRRAAELLYLVASYESVDAAQAALDAVPTDPHEHGKRLPRGSRWRMIMKMAYLLGLLGPSDETRSRMRNTLGWIGLGTLFVVGQVLPLVWVPYMAYSSRKGTLFLARRARAFYAAEQADAGVAVRPPAQLRVGGVALFGRTVVLVVVPVVAALVALLTGLSFAGGRWVDAGLLLIGISAVMTLGWLGLRWWRIRHPR
jgi:hypothetical protein